jgi:hypothetical protein
MKKKIFLKILVGIIILALLIKFLSVIFFEPWLGRILDSELNGENKNYIVEIDNVHILIIKSGIELKGITIHSKQEYGGDRDLDVEIESVKLKDIKLAKAILKHEIHIGTVTISNSFIKIKFVNKTRLNCAVLFCKRRGIESVRFIN